MWRFYLPGPIAFLGGAWAALSVAAAHTLTRRRLPTALLTGVLVALWPKLEVALHMQPQYHRLMMLSYRMLEPFYRFRFRHERKEDERHREEFIERYGFQPEEAVEAELVTLERVIPVAQSQRIDGGTLTVLSVDAYTEGAEVRLRLHLDEEPEQPVTRLGPHDFPAMPEPMLIVHDDLGQRYPMMPGGGGGGGKEWRWDFRIHRPIDPAARELKLEVPQISWERHEPRRGRVDSVERMQTGPWTFEVVL